MPLFLSVDQWPVLHVSTYHVTCLRLAIWGRSGCRSDFGFLESSCTVQTLWRAWGGAGLAQLVARSTPTWCNFGSSLTRVTEHFGFPPSAPWLDNQRPWYVQPCLCDWAYKKDPVPLIGKKRGLSPGSLCNRPRSQRGLLSTPTQTVGQPTETYNPTIQTPFKTVSRQINGRATHRIPFCSMYMPDLAWFALRRVEFKPFVTIFFAKVRLVLRAGFRDMLKLSPYRAREIFKKVVALRASHTRILVALNSCPPQIQFS